MAIEAILFDLGKVIVDFNPAAMLRDMSACSSKSADEFKRVLTDADLAHRYETGAITTEQFHEHLCQFGGLQMALPVFRDAWSSVFAPRLLISEDLLKALHRNYPLILVSNTNEAHVAFIAEAYPVFDYFKHKVFSYQVGAMKPDRRIYEQAIALSGRRPDELFFVDDREENVLAARELGIHAHQFRSEAGLVAALREAGVELGDFKIGVFMKDSTDCAHAGEECVSSLSTPGVMPIYQTSVYDFPDLDVVDEVWEGKQPGFIYGRFGTPNTVALENIVARLEQGEAALASASGMASTMVAFTTLLKAGDEVVVAQDSYGGTISLAVKELQRFGITSRLITDTSPQAVQQAFNERTRALIVETISNPLWNVVDIAAIAKVCRGSNVKLIVDNTSATPCVVRPLTLGADVVFHSATKFLSGHHDVTAGVLIGSREFIARARESAIRLGPSLGAFDAWLAVRGIKTLALRMERTCANALAVAKVLEQHSDVARVHYPGLESHPQREIVSRTMNGNGGAMLSFDIKGDLGSVGAFVKNLEMIRFAPSFGGVTTTIAHPAKTSHRSLSPEQRAEVGITDTLIRLSLGIEDAGDIVADLDRGLRASAG